ncbi:hypothetical protein DAI22_06g123450 [Oryza sativa Japonica Group]|nr:hypothetical protein DAI22_06g123450 [Oryza sativa Japonica Group]
MTERNIVPNKREIKKDKAGLISTFRRCKSTWTLKIWVDLRSGSAARSTSEPTQTNRRPIDDRSTPSSVL